MKTENKNFALAIVKYAKDIKYERPKRTNNLVDSSKYDQIDETVKNTVALTNAATTIVSKESLPILLVCTEKNANYISDTLISDNDKLSIGSKDYIKHSAVIKLAIERSEEAKDAKTCALAAYTAQSLMNISISESQKAQKRDYEDFARKKEKNLNKQRKKSKDINKDEITGEPLEGNGEFHHTDKKSIYTDPVKRLDPDNGVILNTKTHQDIHKNNINDNDSLMNYKNSISKQKNKD